MTNQPTNATPDSETIEIDIDQATELMVQGASKIEAMEQYIEHLTAQLATTQSQAKAWEAWANSLINDDFSCDDIDCEHCEALKNRPQPVDASSLARIARVALEALIPCEGGCTCSMCVLSQTLTPNDIALAQALVGGA